MNPRHAATTPLGGSALGQTLPVMAVTAQDDLLNTVREALDSRDAPVDVLRCRDTAQFGAQGRIPGLAMIALHCNHDGERGQRDLELVRSLAGDAPIVVLSDADTGLARDQALAAGAWDIVATSNTAELDLRLRQALELARTRRSLVDMAERLNQAERRLDDQLGPDRDASATLAGHRIADPSTAFARLIGAADRDAARDIDLCEHLAPEDRERFTAALEQVAAEQSNTVLVVDLLPRPDQRQAVRALLSPTQAGASGEKRTAVVLQPVAADRPSDRPARGPAPDARMALHAALAQPADADAEWVRGLILVGIDEIASLQNAFGLAGSDRLLQDVGLHLLDHINGTDRVFRFGAGEYVLLVTRQSDHAIDDFAQSTHARLSEEIFGSDPHSARLAASLTWGVLSGSASDNDAQLRTLLRGMYALREDGGDSCRKYTPDSATETDTDAHTAWAARLRDALAGNRFSLAYQSITSLAGDSQPYFDALLRYVDDNGTLVRPGEFLPAAEQLQMMPSIDRWVVQRAIDVIWQQQSRDTHIALFVKLSRQTIENVATFVTWLETAIEARPIQRFRLILCLPESDVRMHTRAAHRLAGALAKSGFRLALSHYGSTTKSIQVLDWMPVHFIKLSPDFAAQILDRDADERLTRIVARARERDIPLIAEQIEDANSMARLWQAGINYVQGHFIQEPDTHALGEDSDTPA